MLGVLHTNLLGIESPATARVRAWLGPDRMMLPREALAPSVRFSSDMCSFAGSSLYVAAAKRWTTDAATLLQPGYRSKNTRFAALSEDTVSVHWRAEWEPPTLQWAPGLARLLRWDIERFDIDPTTVSSFSWTGVLRLFRTAASSGTLRLPCASVEGQALISLDEAGEHVIAHKESIDLVRLADRGRLLNRRAAQDLAEYLDVARRPDETDPDEWAATVRARVLSGVPGAGTLDLEPSTDPGEAPAALAAFALIAAVAVYVSAGVIGGESNGVPFGENANSAVCDEMMAAIGSTSSQAYAQCVSDLF